jgi:hypothetical protein
MIQNVYRSSRKVPPLFLSDFNETNILDMFSENNQESNVCKYFSESRVVPWKQTDERTDMTKQIVAFRNFAKSA